jgi:hypothetical protein
MKTDLASAFEVSKAAYRLVDGQVLAIGVEHQASAIQSAIVEAEAIGADAARKHLIKAASELRLGNWADSVRESIHSVEAAARKIVPEADALGTALSELEKRGHIHGGLKRAFSNLYGYASDEEGVRHALVLKEKADVDETDALFMLGACASFVSYLIARDR